MACNPHVTHKFHYMSVSCNGLCYMHVIELVYVPDIVQPGASAWGRWPGKKVAPGACSADDATAKVWSPAPAPHSRSHHDLACISVVAGMWSARGRGAALGRRCRRPAAAAAARVRVLGSCRLARAPAALWRCRSRARPRPLLGPAGALILWPREAGRGAPARRRRWHLAADRAPPMLGQSTCC